MTMDAKQHIETLDTSGDNTVISMNSAKTWNNSETLLFAFLALTDVMDIAQVDGIMHSSPVTKFVMPTLINSAFVLCFVPHKSSTITAPSKVSIPAKKAMIAA